MTALLLLAAVTWTSQGAQPAASLEQGFAQLYQLQFEAARQTFHVFLQSHPDHPTGYIALAASYLFEEFHRQGVLSSTFFLDDRRLLGGIAGVADPTRTAAFLAALDQARRSARARLARHPRDPDSLYALTLADGLEADYQALIAHHPLAAVRLLRRAQHEASQLLQVRADGDAYVALGAGHYIVGCLPAYKRLFLWLGGVTGDRQQGIVELRRAAQQGHLLRPYAQALLALVYLRERQPQAAHQLFAELHRQFPANPVFAAELARLERR